MEPTKPPGQNFTYHGPPGTDIRSLDVYRDTDEGVVMSAWKPSPEELAQLNAGGSIALWVWRMPPPPVAVEVSGPVNERGEEATWHGNEIGYTWPETPADAAADEEEPGLGMAVAGEEPSASDLGDDVAAGRSPDDSSP